MNRIRWQDESFELRRVVLHHLTPAAFAAPIRTLAERLGVPVATPDARPAAGDVWVGCSPERGWGDADPRAVGWYSAVEVPAAVDVLREAAERQRRYGWNSDNQDEPVTPYRIVGH